MTDAAAHGRNSSVRPEPATLVGHFRRQVAERAGAEALYFRAGERYRGITWSDFGRAALRLSAYLLDEGLAEHDCIGIVAGNRPEWHIADVAILSLRCRTVPVQQRSGADELARVVAHSDTRAVIVETQVMAGRLTDLRERLPSLRTVVVIDGEPPAAHRDLVVSWQDALQRGDEARFRHAPELEGRARAVTPDDIATILYTRGTTGPKAVQLTHRNIAAAVGALSEFVPVDDDDRVVSHLPLAHIDERLWSEFSSYVHGHPVWFVDDPERLAARLREVRPTLFMGVPHVWEEMAASALGGIEALPRLRRWAARWAIRTSLRTVRDDAARQPPRPRLAERAGLRRLRAQLGFDATRFLVGGAAPIRPDVLRFFRALGLEVLEVYGQAEDTGAATMNRPGRSRIGTAGVPLAGNHVRVADDGEILVRGPVVFGGYFRDDAATAQALSDSWLHTGDIGELDAAGHLRVTDRRSDRAGGGAQSASSSF